MNYQEMRDVALSGDVLLVEGRSLIGMLIRALTGQQISHVALLIWITDTLWVAEMKEGIGYRLLPASLWVADMQASRATVYYGSAPEQVLQRPFDLVGAVLNYRQRRYSYLSLIPIWWAQITRSKRANVGLVCSTFVQRIWESAGMKFDQTADPGDYMRLCTQVMALEGESDV